MENMRKINPYQYVVWTQAGFRKAVRLFQGREEDCDPVEGFPDKYPCVVTFAAGYRGYHYWLARCEPLTTAIVKARTYLDKLIAADDEHQADMAKERLNAKEIAGAAPPSEG